MKSEIKIFSGSANVPLAEKICKSLKMKLGKSSIAKFSNDNIKVRILESVRGKDVYVIQSSSIPVNDGIMEMLIMIDAIKHAKADRITAILPYYPYVRSDKKDEPRISITARLIADLLETAGADQVVTMNLHSPQIAGFFRIPVDHLLAGKVICDYFVAQGLDKSKHVVVAPDAGSAKRAGVYAERLGLPLAILDKRRRDDSESPTINNVIGEVKGRHVLIFDDEIASGGSILEVVKALEMLNVKSIQACAVHAVLSGTAVEKLRKSSLTRLVVTDTVYIPPEKKFPQLTILSVADVFAKAIMSTNKGTSISGLFDNY